MARFTPEQAAVIMMECHKLMESIEALLIEAAECLKPQLDLVVDNTKDVEFEPDFDLDE